MRHPLLAPDLRELIVERDGDVLREFFAAHHPAGAAELLDDLEPDEVRYVLDLLDGRHRAEVFTYLDEPLKESLVERLDAHGLASIVTYMSHDERADLIGGLPEEKAEQVLPMLAQAEREDIRRLASYQEGTAGAVMTSDYAALPAELTAAAALERLRREAPDRETIYYCYVLDEQRRLVGIVSLKNLILASPGRRVAEIMQREVISAEVDEDVNLTAQKLAEYDLLALPVVDHEHRMIGIVTHDDVLDVVVEKASEDVYRMGGVQPLEDSYLRTSFVSLWGKRALWLSILFVGGFLTTTVLHSFEALFQSFPHLFLFVPLIVSVGGNCGSQSATLITRALGLGELTPGEWFRVLVHEVLMGLSLGLSLGLIGFVRAAVVGGETWVETWRLAGVVATGVAVVVLCGNLLGAMLPLLLKRLGFDPALMSNPLVASLVDVTGILAYLSIARLLY